MSNKTTILATAIAAAFAFGSLSARAAVSADEAKQLGTTLTEFGAEKAANKDGSIPAYTGGLDKVAGYDPKASTVYVDPFANEKPLYSIDAKNMAQYDAVLTEGTKALLKRHADFRIDVYPSHRSFRYAPYALQNSVKNATTAKLAGQVDGDAIEGADKGNLPFSGIPFPIPKTGTEVMWNNNLRFSAAVSHNVGAGWLIDSAGNVSDLPSVNEYFMHPWYEKTGKLRSMTFNAVFGLSSTMTAPPSAAGGHFLNYYGANAAEDGQRVWFYTPGQRRVRLAPEFAYDVPLAAYGGVIFWDEIYGFVGRMDRFDFKLVGKKEMLVPYNVFGITNTFFAKDFIGTKFVNPAAVRWEKHRVWVVDSVRKATARHAYSRRTFYIDEDCWCITTSEAYDNAGKIWRVHHINNFPSYDTGGINVDAWTTYDLIKGNYFTVNTGHKEPGNSIRHYESAEGLSVKLTAQAVAAGGVR